MLKKGKNKSKAEGLLSACILPAFHINYSSLLPGHHLPSTLPYQPGRAVVDKVPQAQKAFSHWPAPAAVHSILV